MQENRQSWAEATGVHRASEFYDLDGFLNGNSTLHDFELDELGPVEGIDFDSKYSYFFDPEGYTVDDDRDYADPEALLEHITNHGWAHHLDEVLSAFLAEGLELKLFHEHDVEAYKPWPFLEQIEPGIQRYRIPADMAQIPLEYSLLAQKPV